MKTLFRVLFAAALSTAATGCESFLDINENPNQATVVTPDALLASALVTTAANYTGGQAAGQNYNSYSSFAAGYWGKSGTVSGFNEEQNYRYSTSYYAALFANTYDNLNDYNLIQLTGATTYPNHAAIARIMKAYNYLLLVDQYGNIPYTNALKGIANTSPTYDDQKEIYKDLIVQLKGAVADINAVPAGSRAVGAEDVVFAGNMTQWKRFANSLLLRILLRESQADAATVAAAKTELTALQTSSATDGFITADVVVQPNYAANTDQQNPFYTRYGFPAGSTRATSEYSFVMPTNYIIAQYESNKDPRITQLYRLAQRNVPGTKTAVAAYVGTDLGEANPPQFDPTDGVTTGSRFLQGGTFLRGANAPTVLMLLSEHLFSKAEAETRGLIAGGEAAAKTDFTNGIKASFLHTYRAAATAPGTLAAATAATPGVTQFDTYIAANTTNPLVNYDLATTNGALGKQSVIIYQKYLAENTVASTEAWDDYRRTGQPKFKQSLKANGVPLPKRLLYPLSETSTNLANVPKEVTQDTPLFWDTVD